MGILFTKSSDQNNSNSARVLMLGLDASGKTTLLYRLKLDEVVLTIPTIGFNVETVTGTGHELTIWDVGGQPKVRCLWPHYFANTKVVVYVVDSSDRDRIEEISLKYEEAADELNKLLNLEELKKCHFLIYANKQDLPGSMTPSEVEENLGLDVFQDRQWFVQGSCAITGEGLEQGLEWIVSACNLKPKVSPFLMLLLLIL